MNNRIQEGGGDLGVKLKFNSMDDFTPEGVCEQVSPLKKLVDKRKHLSNLLAKIDGNDEYLEQVQLLLQDKEMQEKIKHGKDKKETETQEQVEATDKGE